MLFRGAVGQRIAFDLPATPGCVLRAFPAVVLGRFLKKCQKVLKYYFRRNTRESQCNICARYGFVSIAPLISTNRSSNSDGNLQHHEPLLWRCARQGEIAPYFKCKLKKKSKVTVKLSCLMVWPFTFSVFLDHKNWLFSFCQHHTVLHRNRTGELIKMTELRIQRHTVQIVTPQQ